MSFRSILSLIPLVSLSLLASSASLSDKKHAVFETVNLPQGWTRLSDAPSERQLKLRIAVKQSNFDELERQLFEVSNPHHPRYGQHLSDEDVHTLISPHDESLDAVKEWLLDHQILEHSSFSPANDWVTVSVPVSKAEEMLDTKYGVYQHTDGDYLLRTEAYSLPQHLHGHIDLVQPTTMFGRLHGMRSTLVDPKKSKPVSKQTVNSTASSDPFCKDGKLVLNRCIRELYNTMDYAPASGGKSQIGITGYLGEVALHSDLFGFMLFERIDQIFYNFGIQSVNNGSVAQTRTADQIAQQKGVEANLDAQTVAGIVAPLPSTFYSVAGEPPFTPDEHTDTNTNEPYLEFLDYITTQSNIAQVISTSYGDDEQTVPLSYAQRVCQGFAQLGAKGISLLVASGDFGIGNDDMCISNVGKNATKFLPSFPASCPFVTTVGATQGVENEVATTAFASGAGFSDYFPQPSYQSDVANSYIASLGKQYTGLYNKAGRAYPDVAALGSNYAIAYNGQFIPVSGTSASTPTFSSIITLLNDYLISQGKPVLGFLNPWLYQIGYQGLNDITEGSSYGCNVDGFPAATGWDAVTGLGTPDFKKLQKLVGQPIQVPAEETSGRIAHKTRPRHNRHRPARLN